MHHRCSANLTLLEHGVSLPWSCQEDAAGLRCRPPMHHRRSDNLTRLERGSK
eukprot:NODE_26639_length_543_cov_4.615385.p5 GENE.NODE_26639_length_543_cov_4.615385~~NODE_26639_length_543_cov_4.615385.p5  ORF type:complete len:52 (-),score=5.24 NODE_26639_length_543_cov_4.615385:172-327(-)